jgi:histone-lysine N-methyltransferase SETMAR
MYTDILRHLRVAFRRKRHEKWRTDSWFVLHDNAPAHRSVLVKDFFTKNSVTTLEHPPYSPALAPAAIYLFSRKKSALKGRRFCDTTDTVMYMTEEPKRLLQNGFQEYF